MRSQAWPPAAVRARLAEHRELASSLRSLSLSRELDGSIESSLARYLVVRSTGLIEATRDDVVDQYVQAFKMPRVHRRVTRFLRRGEGVAPDQLVKFIGSFDSVWQAEFEAFLAENDSVLASDLGAMVDARKKIAHGNGNTVSTGRALAYADSARKISEWLIARFDPTK